jgi:hypothetical protein
VPQLTRDNGELKITDFPDTARNLMIHSTLSYPEVGGGLSELSWKSLSVEDPGVLPLPSSPFFSFLLRHVPRDATLIGNATGLPNDNQKEHCDCKWTVNVDGEAVPEDTTSILFFFFAQQKAKAPASASRRRLH